ncbi:acid phosphatase [Daedalea quercina L-15889]|uniref:Phytase A n=1 Tax=Daedalea quercina L-15889 TaxID=1314783 RepID=A0A165R3U0_9APHY|nr:acid phosphatase [Daedalea quercina L-15889]
MVLAITGLFILASLAQATSALPSIFQPRFMIRRSTDDTNTTGVFGPDSKIWGEETPYYAVADYVSPPSSCEIDQVNLLQRHGARYPKKNPTKAMKSAIKKLQKVTITESSMQFISNFTYDLAEDDLTPYGAVQSFDAGIEAYQRYSFLVNTDSLPFVRASSSTRVVESAGNWTAGFAYGSNSTYEPVLSVIISEDGNDTLDDASCDALSNSDSPGDQESAWIDVYTPNITDYLNSGASGASLDNSDTQYLIELCPYVTVAYSERSEWCDLFSSLGIFPDYEYYGDLDKYYTTGWGQGTLGPAQGIGYMNELLARLTNTPVNDSTSTNTTLDSDPTTFPLNRTFYADFTHDDLLIAVYSAMGLFPTPTLNYTSTDDKETSAWRVDQMTPFAGRMVVERISCSDAYASGEGEYVRVLVNQAVQSMPFCDSDDNDLCSLDTFVESQAFARNSGYGIWDECSD